MTIQTCLLLGGLDFQDFAPLVVSALRAGAVRHLALVAIRALGERVAAQRIMRAAPRGTGFRVSSFWIRHSSVPLFVFLIETQSFASRFTSATCRVDL